MNTTVFNLIKLKNFNLLLYVKKMFRKNNNKANSSKNCINPLFEKWILDWRDDAVAKDLQSKHTYNKVIFF